jgi:predicted phage terminase large subunit-like protein
MADEPESLKDLLSQSLSLPKKYVPQSPTPHQAAFLLCPQREVFFGGAASGGKSSALLMAALQYVEHPEYRALLLRRTFQDLSQPGALIDRSKEWLKNTDAKWNESRKEWTFPSGAVVKFGYMDSENDKYNYQGAEYKFVGFDELTQFTETMYRYLFSRMRRNKDQSGIPIRMRAAGNPGGIGHEWVKQRFKTDLEEDPSLNERRIFIPAGLDDNPHVDKEEYEEALAELDPVTRAQLRNGDWDVVAQGNLFREDYFDGRILEHMPTGVEMIRKVRYWDLASTDEEKVREKKGDADFTASCLMGLGNDGNVYVLEMTQDRRSPMEIERLVKSKAERDAKPTRASTMIYMEEEPGASGKNTIDMYARYVLMGYPFYGDKPGSNKVERARPASSAAEGGYIYLIKGSWTKRFLAEACAFPNGIHDDMVDAFTGAFSKVAMSAIMGRDYKQAALNNKKQSRRKLWG